MRALLFCLLAIGHVGCGSQRHYFVKSVAITERQIVVVRCPIDIRSERVAAGPTRECKTKTLVMPTPRLAPAVATNLETER